MQKISDDFLLQLIIQDIRIFQLRQGLRMLGFESDALYTELPELVMQFLDIASDEQERGFDRYTRFLTTVSEHSMLEPSQFEFVARQALYLLLNRELNW